MASERSLLWIGWGLVGTVFGHRAYAGAETASAVGPGISYPQNRPLIHRKRHFIHRAGPLAAGLSGLCALV